MHLRCVHACLFLKIHTKDWMNLTAIVLVSGGGNVGTLRTMKLHYHAVKFHINEQYILTDDHGENPTVCITFD